MRTLVWGAGAIGGTLGAYLARAGRDVTLVDTVAEHVAAVNRDGLRVTGPIDEFVVRVPAHTPETLSGTWPEVILATKAHHTESAVRSLAPHLAPDGYVVSAQNGLNELAIAEVVGPARTVGAFVNFGADYLEPGVIHFGGRGAVVVGEIDGQMTPRALAIRDAWQALDAREMLAVASARSVTPEAFDGFDPGAYRPTAPTGAAEASLDALVAHNRKSAKTHSGIWRDLAVRKRPTEVEAQLGIVVRLAGDAGVPTPVTARLVALIHEIERGERPQGRDALDQLAAVAGASPRGPSA